MTYHFIIIYIIYCINYTTYILLRIFYALNVLAMKACFACESCLLQLKNDKLADDHFQQFIHANERFPFQHAWEKINNKQYGEMDFHIE